MSEAYPLAWPDGWPRTPAGHQVDGRYHFKKVGGDGWRKPYTFAQARDALYAELGKMKASGLVLSTNFQLNQMGEPRGDRGRPADQGIAIYFTRNRRPLVMACDRYERAEENMSSLRLALEAMRQLERHGGGVLAEKAFSGFVALPAPQRPHEILGVPADADEATIRRAWRARIADAHPDQAGSHAAAAEVNAARDAMLKGPRT